MRKYSEEEIKKLIEKGFDIELISFELDVPIEQLRQWEKELQTSQESKNSGKTYSVQEIIDQENSRVHRKIEKMRKRYEKLFFKRNELKSKVQYKQQRELSQQESEIFELVITGIKERIREMQGSSVRDRQKRVREIQMELKKINNYPLRIEHLETIYHLMENGELTGLNLDRKDQYDEYVSSVKRNIGERLTQLIEFEQVQTEDIEKLKMLENKLTLNMIKENQTTLGMMRSKIQNKINGIKRKQAMDRIKNDVSELLKRNQKRE